MGFLSKVIFLLKKNFPYSFKIALLRLKNSGKKAYCNVCNSNLKKFNSGGVDKPILKKLDVIGAGYHEHDYCPVCKAGYRQRLIKYFFSIQNINLKATDIFHIAPEISLYHTIKKSKPKSYTCGDLEPKRYYYFTKPEYIDLTQINKSENSFDLILCSHVLEHIPDDHKAMKEIFRVLRKDGIAILQVPISLHLPKTIEDNSITTETERLEKFGQKDHVRIYGMDYIKRLESVGFLVETFKPSIKDFSLKEQLIRLDSKEFLIIAKKKTV